MLYSSCPTQNTYVLHLVKLQEMEMEMEMEIKINEGNLTVLSCYLDQTSSPDASIRKSGKLY